jgi:hypothetical protein
MFSEIIVTPEQIALYRQQLADNQEALAALDVIEEWDGDLADASESIAKRNGIEGVETNADLRWFVQKLAECQEFICQPKYEHLRNNSLSTIVPILTEFFAASLGCFPGVATIIATPFALTIAQEGMDKFCQLFNSQP